MSGRGIAILGLAGLGGCIAGALVDWTAFLRSWLAATLVLGAAPLAALGVLMTHGLTGGTWGDRSRTAWYSLASLMPLFLLAIVPLLFGLGELFTWTRPADQLPEVVQHKHLYLNVPFFVARNMIYAICWMALPLLLGVFGGRPRSVHGPGLIVWTLTISFFATDWLMSLEPKFYSDVFGLMIITGLGNAGFAAGLLLLPNVSPEVRLDLGNLWLAIVVAWLVMMFSQFLLMWSGNLPDEIGWYVHRREPAWRVVGWTAFALFFAVPFLVLLSTAAKRSRVWIRGTAACCLVGYVLYVYWLVMPSFEDWRPAETWIVPASLIAVCCGGYLAARWIQRRLETDR